MGLQWEGTLHSTLNSLKERKELNKSRLQTMKELLLLKVSVYLSSIMNQNGNFSQEIRRRLGFRRAAVSKRENILKCKDLPLETKTKTIHTMVFPIDHYVLV